MYNYSTKYIALYTTVQLQILLYTITQVYIELALYNYLNEYAVAKYNYPTKYTTIYSYSNIYIYSYILLSYIIKG